MSPDLPPLLEGAFVQARSASNVRPINVETPIVRFIRPSLVQRMSCNTPETVIPSTTEGRPSLPRILLGGAGRAPPVPKVKSPQSLGQPHICQSPVRTEWGDPSHAGLDRLVPHCLDTKWQCTRPVHWKQTIRGIAPPDPELLVPATTQANVGTPSGVWTMRAHSVNLRRRGVHDRSSQFLDSQQPIHLHGNPAQDTRQPSHYKRL